MPLTETLAKSKRLVLDGKEYDIEPLDFNDLADLEVRFGSLDQVNPASIHAARFIAWLALRKHDPTLTAEEREDCRYRLTETEVGRRLKSNSTETMAFVVGVLQLSGMVSDGEAAGKPAKKQAAKAGDSTESPSS
jgi:hypothetical protein